MNTPEHYQPILYLDPADVIGPLPTGSGQPSNIFGVHPSKTGVMTT